MTKEYRRFAEFCNVCLRDHYIGLCYGPPGVGKTVSARHYAKWHLLEHRLPRYNAYRPLPPEIPSCRTLFYTPEMSSTPRTMHIELREMRLMLSGFLFELVTARKTIHHTWGVPPDRCDLIIVDEADHSWRSTAKEQLCDIYDQSDTGLILIGMPGLEKRMSRYPQLTPEWALPSEYRPLSTEEMHFILEHHWERLGIKLQRAGFFNSEAVRVPLRALPGKI